MPTSGIRRGAVDAARPGNDHPDPPMAVLVIPDRRAGHVSSVGREGRCCRRHDRTVLKLDRADLLGLERLGNDTSNSLGIGE